VGASFNDAPDGTIPVFSYGAAPGGSGSSLASFEEVSTSIAVSEVKKDYAELWTYKLTDAGYDASSGLPDVIDKRHLEGCNFLFVDGHVKFLRQSKPYMWTSRSDT
jgi:prepilin-type processing-associated H-X9-DG protein